MNGEDSGIGGCRDVHRPAVHADDAGRGPHQPDHLTNVCLIEQVRCVARSFSLHLAKPASTTRRLHGPAELGDLGWERDFPFATSERVEQNLSLRRLVSGGTLLEERVIPGLGTPRTSRSGDLRTACSLLRTSAYPGKTRWPFSAHRQADDSPRPAQASHQALRNKPCSQQYRVAVISTERPGIAEESSQPTKTLAWKDDVPSIAGLSVRTAFHLSSTSHKVRLRQVGLLARQRAERVNNVPQRARLYQWERLPLLARKKRRRPHRRP